MSDTAKYARLAYILIAAFTFIADQFSKNLIEHRIGLYEVVPVIPHFFNLTHSQNPGAAFGLFSDSPSLWKTVLLIVISALMIAAVLAVAWRSPRLDWKTGTGLALIMGGALSNLADRIRFGRVTDFLDVYYRSYHWYTFNVADSAIVIGAFLLILKVGFSDGGAAVKTHD
jgi:signal peptidase II